MSDKIQMTEGQAREIYHNCILTNQITTEGCFMNGMKQSGHIEQERNQYKALTEINLKALEIANKHINKLKQEKAELIKILSGTLEIASQLMSNDSFQFHFEQEILFLQKYEVKP